MESFNDVYHIPEESDITEIHNNNKDIRVIVACQSDDFSKNNVLLEKILSSVGLDFKMEVLVLDQEHYSAIEMNKMMDTLKPTWLISFGISFQEIGWQFNARPFEICHLETIKAVIFPNLKAISENQETKRQLWTVLKKSFKPTK